MISQNCNLTHHSSYRNKPNISNEEIIYSPNASIFSITQISPIEFLVTSAETEIETKHFKTKKELKQMIRLLLKEGKICLFSIEGEMTRKVWNCSLNESMVFSPP